MTGTEKKITVLPGSSLYIDAATAIEALQEYFDRRTQGRLLVVKDIRYTSGPPYNNALQVKVESPEEELML